MSLLYNLELLAAAAVTVLLIYLLGQRRAIAFDEAMLSSRIARDFPGFSPQEIVIGRDGKSALALDGRSGDFILCFLLGARPVCWRLPRARLAEAEPMAGGEGLVIPTADPARRRITILLPPGVSGDHLTRDRPVEAVQ